MLQARLISQYNCILAYLLAITLFSNSCTCTNGAKPPITSNRETKQPSQRTGIWHTGVHRKDDIVQPTPPLHSQVPHFYTTTYDKYRVTHDGSCGYRSFIPILLNGILTNKNWKSWLENLLTTIYNPGKKLIETVDLSGTNYMQIRPTDDPDKLLQDTKDLLQKLDIEPAARKLEEPEIQLLVKFMRQIVLINIIIQAYNNAHLEEDNTNIDMVKFKNQFEAFFTLAGGIPNSTDKEFWANVEVFTVFNIPYILLADPNANKYKEKYFMITYYKSPTDWQSDAVHLNGLDFLTNPAAKIHVPSDNKIILYQHNTEGCMFEYLVPKEKN